MTQNQKFNDAVIAVMIMAGFMVVAFLGWYGAIWLVNSIF